MSAFAIATLAGALLVVTSAALLRGRFYAIFAAVICTVEGSIAVAIAPRFAAVWPVFVYLQAATFVHLLSLVRARLRPVWWRVLVSVPASWFVAGTVLAWPWAVARAFGFQPAYAEIAYVVAFVGLVQSFSARRGEVHLVLGQTSSSLARLRGADARVERPLRIVQISDPHLGPFMSPARLRRICERAVAHAPDLVVLTGDFLTMESHGHVGALAEGLAPLGALEGRTFACFGNHDHEDPATVREGLARAGVTLLVDDARTIETPAGRVQVVGLDFSFVDRRRRIEEALRLHPREEDALRVVLLHDPGAFRHVPDGEADLVLSGHTHGGQLGLVGLGLRATIVSALTSIPDHGAWVLGRNVLYVHRGTGHYGFPLRVGVPAEESVLAVHARARG